MSAPLQKNKIRNIGIMAHIDAGKTTLSERILYYTGLSRKIGEVHEGTAIMDWMEQERERGISISSAATACFWEGAYINLIDTPGHVDFTIEVERSLRVLDGAVAVFDSVQGVETQSETVWRQADKYKVPRICFLNKMDRIGADFEKSLASIEQKLSLFPLPIQWPVGSEESFQGVLDLVDQKMKLWDQGGLGESFSTIAIPEKYKKLEREKRALLLEKLAERDEVLMEKYLQDEEILPEEIRSAIRKQTLSLQISPILCGSALKNKGIQLVLSAVKDYLPSPLDIPPAEGKDISGQRAFCPVEDEKPLSALVFKIAFDSFSGALSYVRVYSGVLRAGSMVYNLRQKKTERVQKLLKMRSNMRHEVEELRAGDIGVISGLKWTQTGDSLCPKEHCIALEPLSFPDPVLSVALEPKTASDQAKMEESLSRLQREDPSCQIKRDPETGQTLLMGMGELHIEILLSRLLKDYKLPVRSGKPQVSFRETPSRSWQGEGTFDQEIQTVRHFASLSLSIEPLERGQGTVFDKGKYAHLSSEILSALEEGLEEGLSSGPLMAWPVVDLKVSLLDLKYKEEALSLIALRACLHQTLCRGMREASCQLLEPVFCLSLHCPEEFTGAVTGDLSRRRGRMQRLEKKGAFHLISASAPLMELFGYATVIRSLTQGRASFSMEMEGYGLLPEKLKQKFLL